IADVQVIVAEVLIEPDQTVVRVSVAQHEQVFGRQTVDRRLDVINGRNVAQHGRIVGWRFGASLTFVIGKDEGLVFLDRSADSAAKLILAQHIEAGRGENADGVKFVIAQIVVNRTVHVVGATFSDDVHNTGSGSSKFRSVVAVDDPKFLHRLLGRRATLDARGSGDVIGAVDGNEIVVNVLAGEGKLGERFDDHVVASRGRVSDGDAGRKQSEIDELPSVDGKALDFLLINDRAHHGSSGLSNCANILHLDLGLNLAESQREIHIGGRSQIQMNLLGGFLEALLFGIDGVIARRQSADLIFANGIGSDGALQPGGRIYRGNRRFCNHGAGGVRDASLESAGDGLGSHPTRRGQYNTDDRSPATALKQSWLN